MSFGRVGRVGRFGGVGRAGRLILALALAVALGLARSETGQGGAMGQSAAALSCQVRQHRTGRVCWCWVSNRWVSSPMALCRISR